MINLSSSSHQLRIILNIIPAGSPADECQCVTNYRTTSDTTYNFGSYGTLSNGTISEVLLYGNSVGSSIRVVDDINIYNPGASVIVTIVFYDGTSEFILVRQTLAQYKTLTYNDKNGWTVI